MLAIAGLAMLIAPLTLQADEFVLKSGGVIHGEWMNRHQSTATGYVIRTDSGGKITLPKAMVVERKLQSPALSEYEQIAPTFADSVADQWQLAQWCQRRKLNLQRKTHLARVLELDTDNAEARAALGYSQVNGRWMQREDWRLEEGLVYHEGRWRMPQDVQLMIEQKHVRDAQREWLQKLKTWRHMLEGERSYQAREQILAIRDPHALPALVALYTREPHRAVKQIYIETIHAVAHTDARGALILLSLNDPDIEMFYSILDLLLDEEHVSITQAYVNALKDDNNVRINRGGYALGQINDPEAIGPLIESLVTNHIVVRQPPQESSGSVTTSFVRGAPNGICKTPPKIINGLNAGKKSNVIPVRANNPEVLSALIRMSGGINFGYDQQAWRNWHATQKRAATVSVDFTD